MVLVSSADHTSASTTVHDRGKPNRAKPDERRSVQTFEAQAQRRGVPGDAREWQHTRQGGVHDHAESETTIQSNRAVETTPSTRAACGGQGSEWCWETTGPRAANTWVSTWTGEQLVETTQALDEPRHHTAKTVCVRRSRGETDALASSDAGKLVQLESASQRSE